MSYPHYTGESADWGDSGRLCRRWNGKPPEIVTLCGSTRFKDTFRQKMLELTLEGKIVLTIGCDTKTDMELVNELGKTFEDAKPVLDQLHKRKIDISDYILVLNVGGYIGDSTRGEISHAVANGIPVHWLEQLEKTF